MTDAIPIVMPPRAPCANPFCCERVPYRGEFYATCEQLQRREIQRLRQAQRREIQRLKQECSK